MPIEGCVLLTIDKWNQAGWNLIEESYYITSLFTAQLKEDWVRTPAVSSLLWDENIVKASFFHPSLPIS